MGSRSALALGWWRPRTFPTLCSRVGGAQSRRDPCSNQPAVVAPPRETNKIPVLFVTVTDPVGRGFVASLAHPGGNITGFSDFDAPMAGKRLKMLTQIMPPVVRLAVLFDPATAPQAGLMLRAIEDRPILRGGGSARARSKRFRDRGDDGRARARRARRGVGFGRNLHLGASRRHRRRCRTASPPLSCLMRLKESTERWSPTSIWGATKSTAGM
jgi:hypothetical protein